MLGRVQACRLRELKLGGGELIACGKLGHYRIGQSTGIRVSEDHLQAFLRGAESNPPLPAPTPKPAKITLKHLRLPS